MNATISMGTGWPVMRTARLGQHPETSCSIVVVIDTEQDDNGIELSKNSGVAMYHAQEIGLDNVQLFHPTMAEART